MLRSGASPVQTSLRFSKMSPVDVLTMVKKLDRRTLAIEQILPTLATKEDLKIHATKDDLTIYATKEDLKVYATKEDLKEALAAFPTRSEMEEKFEEAKRYALVLHEDLKSDIALIAKHLADVMTRLPRTGAS
jgi:hypothetical protein